MNHRLNKLAEALCITPTNNLRLELSHVGGKRAWWLCGCKEGDQALPQTGNAETAEEALGNAERWLAPELDRLDWEDREAKRLMYEGEE